jgi:hypothetical protein
VHYFIILEFDLNVECFIEGNFKTVFLLHFTKCDNIPTYTPDLAPLRFQVSPAGSHVVLAIEWLTVHSKHDVSFIILLQISWVYFVLLAYIQRLKLIRYGQTTFTYFQSFLKELFPVSESVLNNETCRKKSSIIDDRKTCAVHVAKLL